MMDTIAFIRLHAFEECPETVWDAIAKHADGICFLANNASGSLIRRATAHPSCVEVRIDNKPWANHHSLRVLGHWADEFKPKVVFTFDEDELPPVRLGSELAKWKDDDQYQTMSFHHIWCWGDTGTVVRKHFHRLKEHVKVYTWKPDISKRGFTWQCRLSIYGKTMEYYCPYPMRHLPVMTPGLRKVRELRPEYTVWWNDETPTMPYDPDKVYEDYLKG